MSRANCVRKEGPELLERNVSRELRKKRRSSFITELLERNVSRELRKKRRSSFITERNVSRELRKKRRSSFTMESVRKERVARIV